VKRVFFLLNNTLSMAILGCLLLITHVFTARYDLKHKIQCRLILSVMYVTSVWHEKDATMCHS
jgi:hypothetical protein